jgi:hypothetical protein
MVNPYFESDMSPADDDAFGKSLDAMMPQAASVSISQTFYQAGYAAALSQSQASLQGSATQSRSLWRMVSTLAAGILIGIGGYVLGVSKPIATELAERATVTMPASKDDLHIERTESERNAASEDKEDSEGVVGRDEIQEWNASLPFLAYLLPIQKQTLSMGSLPVQDTQNGGITLAHAPANSYRVALTSHPANSQSVLNSLFISPLNSEE